MAPRSASSQSVVIAAARAQAARGLRVVNVPVSPVSTIAVPGLGFDIPHFFAVHPDAARRLRRRGVLGASVFPFLDSGFIVSVEPMVVQAQPIIVQQPVIIQQVPQVAEREDAAENSGGSAAASEEPAAKRASASMDYVFVRRDGRVFFAVAFMRENDHVEYITPEGNHRSVALNALDLEATQRFNEERGLTFRLPA
ncbi:MAG TPA: hypothetical protein VHE23_04730 [Candidatus Acidoferrales bacterium]|nr:hypothetical protein [Candidatus Acidoferrales bacterium]